MSKVVYGYRDWVEGSCGLGLVADFSVDSAWGRVVITTGKHGGCDFLQAGFIDESDCQAAYEQLCAKYKLVYQSPVRKNRNSGNDFFFCIFDTKLEE